MRDRKFTKNSKGRTSRLRLIELIPLTVVLLVFIACFGVLNLFQSSFKICENSTCSSINRARNVQNIHSEIEDLNFKLLLQQGNLTRHQTSKAALGNSQLVVELSKFGTINIGIPMRNGLSTTFPVSIVSMKKSEMIQISIFDSREFLVTRGNKIVYSHRYLSPVFFADPDNPIQIINSNQNLELLVVPNSLTLSISLIPWYILLAKILLTIGSFICISFIVKCVLQKFFESEKKQISMQIPIFSLCAIWAFSLGRWLLMPRDDTGSSNPSPFAQIGPAFSDIMQIFQAGKFSKPYDYGAVNYPPTALYLIRLFGPLSVGISALVVFAFSFGVLMWLLSGFNFNKKRYQNYILTFPIILSYPIIFALIRGNLDLLVVSLIGLSLNLYIVRGLRKIGILLLSIAIAIKFWPVVFVIFLIKKRDFLGSLLVIAGSMAITLASAYLLGYHKFSDEFHIIWNTLGLFNGTPTVNTFIYSFSLGGFFLAISIFIASHFSLHPTSIEILQGLRFIKSKEYLLALLISIVIISYLIWKSRRNDSIILYCSALALLESSVSYAYRATILFVCLVLRMSESTSFLRLDTKSKNLQVKQFYQKVLRNVEIIAWLCILAPTTFYYVRGSLFSTSSVIQPIALVCIVFVESFFERNYHQIVLQSNRMPNKIKISPGGTIISKRERRR